MSEEIRPVFKPKVSGLVYDAEGKGLADQIRRIHSYSKKNGPRPLTDFLDNRDMPEEEEFDEDEWAAGRSDWHAPAEGLAAVRALMQAVQSDPKTAQRWNKEDPDGLETLMGDLEALAECLEVGAAQGVQFRLDLM